MLHIISDNSEFGILFKHDRLIKQHPPNRNKGLKMRSQKHPFRTSCVVFKNETPIGTGVAKVDSRDQFEYEKGRKISLEAAIKAAGLPRKLRSIIWKGYNNR